MTRPLSRHVILSRFLALTATALLASTSSAQNSFSDNFNTGTDTGWTRVEPIGDFGSPGTYSFPGGNTYRIQAAAPLGAVGPARAAAIRQNAGETAYTDFTQTVNLVNFDNTLTQSFGLMSRVSDIGLGTTDGYAFLYDRTNNTATIYSVTNEAVTDIGNAVIAGGLTAGTSYQMRFDGNGSALQGRIFLSSDLSTPLADITANNVLYSSGRAGLLVAGNDSFPTGTAADATFDNYAIVPVPEPTVILGVAAFAGLAVRRLRKSRAKS